ncbi:MAG: hypothetical protein AAB261_00630, partial [Chloroflexota bacterium]
MRSRFYILLIIFLTACQGEPASGEAIFVDDFSKNDTGWNRQSNAEAYTRYLDGEYQMWILKSNLIVWTTHDPIVGDAVIQVAARTAGGPENNFFGVICRHQDDKNFYFFIISGDSYYGVGKFKNGERTLLHNALLDRTDKIASGRVAHQIRVECVGSTLSLTVDNNRLARVSDPDFKEGRAGLIVGSYEKNFVDVRFDNL